MKSKKASKASCDPKAECMVRAIQNGDNVKAYKCLESLVKDRVAEKISSALEV